MSVKTLCVHDIWTYDQLEGRLYSHVQWPKIFGAFIEVGVVEHQ